MRKKHPVRKTAGCFLFLKIPDIYALYKDFIARRIKM